MTPNLEQSKDMHPMEAVSTAALVDFDQVAGMYWWNACEYSDLQAGKSPDFPRNPDEVSHSLPALSYVQHFC